MCLVCNRFALHGLTHERCKGEYIIGGSMCAVSYRGVIRKLVYQFKYQPYVKDLTDTITELFYESIIQKEEFSKTLQDNPLFVPIPLSAKKQKSRGYNHAELLAKGLGKQLHIPVVNILKRIKDTKPQFGLKRDERKKNIQGAFVIHEKEQKKTSKKQTIILVDDILTSGSTMLEAAKILKKEGFSKVWGIAFAKD